MTNRKAKARFPPREEILALGERIGKKPVPVELANGIRHACLMLVRHWYHDHDPEDDQRLIDLMCEAAVAKLKEEWYLNDLRVLDAKYAGAQEAEKG
jgi:uncharacterized protein YeaC (DUF1315 family)